MPADRMKAWRDAKPVAACIIRAVGMAAFGACLSALPAAAAPVRVMTVDGRTLEGAWLGMPDASRLILSVEGHRIPLDIAEVMGIHWTGTTSMPAALTPRPADQTTIHLADGSRFPAQITAADGEMVKLRTALLPELELRLSQLAGIRFSSEPDEAAAKEFDEALATRDPTEDTLFIVQDGKVNSIRGLLESLTAEGGTFKWRSRRVPIQRSRTYGVVLATGAGPAPSPQARCILNDGSIWAGRMVAGDETAIRLELTTGPIVRLPVDQLDDTRFRNDRVVFLSDLVPSGYEFKPWGTTRWPYRNDRSVANRPLCVGGRSFERGIGVHSQSVLSYNLSEPFRQFAATVGIDDAVGSRGNVVFRVLTDGREVFNSGTVAGKDEPRPVLVALNGAKTLQLVVDFGEELDIGDQADWGNARLIR